RFFEIQRREPSNQVAYRRRPFHKKRGYGCIDRFLLQTPRVAFVGNHELWIDAGENGVLFQQAGAETVHRGDPGALQPGPDAGDVGKRFGQLLAHITGGLFRERDRQDARRIDLFLNQAPEVFHQNGGLSRARPRDHTGIVVAIGDIDGAKLMLGKGDGVHDCPDTAAGRRTSMRQTSRESQNRQLSGLAGSGLMRPWRMASTNCVVRAAAETSQSAGTGSAPRNDSALQPTYSTLPFRLI